MIRQEFENFIGTKSFEEDDGWSLEVWQAAWDACLKQAFVCNMCGNKVINQAQPDLLTKDGDKS